MAKAVIHRLVFFLFFALSCHQPLAAEAIRFQTDWKAQAEQGGFYQALALGFYEEEGLTVTIRPGGPQISNSRLLAAGALDIAMASNSLQPFVMQAAGVEAKIVMAAFQKDPQILMAHDIDAGSGLPDGLADLKGRPIFIADNALSSIWPWLKARFGYEDRQVRKYTYSIAPWLVDTRAVVQGYISSEPFTARQAGAASRVFLLSDEGYGGYAAMVMVRTAWLEQNPDVVAAFVRASIKGWQSYIFDDQEPANALILKDNPEMTPKLLAYAVREIRDRTMVGVRSRVGHMDRDRWQAFYDQMAALGILPSGLSVSQSISFDFIPPVSSRVPVVDHEQR